MTSLNIKELQEQFNKSGKVVSILVRPGRLEPMRDLHKVRAIAGQGLEGDRHKSNGNRQVTLIQAEHLKAVSSFLGKNVSPEDVRRNICVEGINLLSLKGQKFRLGEDVVLEYSGECHPCSRMEENLGLGGYNAMRGHGGITAKIISGGIIAVGDSVGVIK
jgi:MOSC domain-containing protein YiiM